ncbi:MAG: undecaprenyldiphospho-muramoylpentapeptide beta-N-acetylglucosaminyltransferase [Chloroherpetonaceae bacterium]|nr:undecaprenyldiphospho-muramoylpentapeptide beta-N-acetylglucosaminyltransferase [Chloroherpetonaceae bacterium]
MRIIFAGGGTGGHLYPAVAIAEAVLKLEPKAVISFVGTERGIEATEVPKLGFPLHLISAPSLRRGVSLKAFFDNLQFPFRLYESLNECKRLFFQEEPDVVVGTGGYVSAPVVWQAQRWGIPTLIQEQNAKPGLATRFLAQHADEVHLSFLESLDYFDQDNVFVTGNPTRALALHPKEQACQFFGLDATRKTLLVFGGSLGARSLNQALESWLSEALLRFNVIWQTGKLDFEAIAARVGTRQHLWLGAYIDRMDYAYSAADVVLCRAGASTLAELCNVGAAAILVPYPFAAANHQLHNAEALAESGAAELILDKDIRTEAAKQKVFALLEDEARQALLRANAKQHAKPNAAEKIAKRVIRLAKTFQAEQNEDTKASQ